MGLLRRRTDKPRLPAAAVEALALGKGERVLQFATDDHTGDHVVATNWAIAVVSPDGDLRWRRPWHEVDTGVWQDETSTLAVTWVDNRRPTQWSFHDQHTLLPETLRERVQASVVLSSVLDLGPRRRGRAVIRQDLATRELLSQAVLGPGVSADDPRVVAHVRSALDDLREQVGLPRED
jgi:hypothetical protein